MKISRTSRRLGLAIAAGAAIGLAAPSMPVLGQTSPSDACTQAVLSAQSTLSQFSNVAGLQSQILATNSYLVSVNSQVCKGAATQTTSSTSSTIP